MKLYKKLFLLMASVASAGLLTACGEDDTLNGADAVYVEINPSEITLCYGDTVDISVAVTNVSGHKIETPIEWSIDQKEGEPTVIQFVKDNTAIVALPGMAGHKTRLRATLVNGKYALANVSVVANTPKAVVPIDTANVEIAYKTSYFIGHDSVVFQINPKLLLRDFTPVYTLNGDGLTEYAEQPMYVDYDRGTVAIHYAADRKAGMGEVTLSIGDGATALTGSCVIRMDPPIEGASFYGPDYAGMTYIETRPPLHTIEQYWARTYERNMDIGSRDTCRLAVNVQTGAEIDILEAYKVCSWKCLEGTSAMIVDMYNEYVPGNGFDAVIVVASGISKGQTIFQFGYPNDTLTATFNVYDMKNDFPVDEIIVSEENLELFSGQTKMITTGVVPMSSYGIHKPKAVAADPTIISIGNYVGNEIPITGLKDGETYITLTANSVTKRVSVKVKEGVTSVNWGDAPQRLFAGQTAVWNAKVETPSGGANQFAAEWLCDNDEVASVTPVEGTLDQGLVKALSAGTAKIRAKVLNKYADERTLTVLPCPVDFTFTTGDLIDAYGEKNDYYIVITCGEDKDFKIVNLTFKNAFTGDAFGTFTVNEGSEIEIDNVKLEMVSGSVTVTRSSKADMCVLNGSVTFKVPGIGNVTYTFADTEANTWE